MSGRIVVSVSELTTEGFAAYGTVLGKPLDSVSDQAYSGATSDFWQEHLFEYGGGAPEILWVNYRDVDPLIDRVEMHALTEQAVVPLTGSIVQILAISTSDGQPDPSSVKAFRIPVGKGICMRPGCWHATRVPEGPATCMMLTRQSTTMDLIGHLRFGRALSETAYADAHLQLAGL